MPRVHDSTCSNSLMHAIHADTVVVGKPFCCCRQGLGRDVQNIAPAEYALVWCFTVWYSFVPHFTLTTSVMHTVPCQSVISTSDQTIRLGAAVISVYHPPMPSTTSTAGQLVTRAVTSGCHSGHVGYACGIDPFLTGWRVALVAHSAAPLGL